MLEKIYFGTYTRNNSKGIYQAELDTEKKEIRDLELFIDTLDATQIEKYLKDEVADKHWQSMLEEAYQVGRINETTYQEYIYG